MPNTVPTHVNLPADEPVPFVLTAAGVRPPEPPRTWSFTDRTTGETVPYTCMAGCTANHTVDMEEPVFAQDIWCQTSAPDETLPVSVSPDPVDMRVLGITLNVIPHSPVMSMRMPFVGVEIVADHWLENLDPDGLATVISTLERRVEMLKVTHGQLLDARDEYRRRRA